LATIHPLQTDGRTTTMPIARLLLKYDRLNLKSDKRPQLVQTFYPVQHTDSCLVL